MSQTKKEAAMVFNVRIHTHDGDVIYRTISALSEADAVEKAEDMLLGMVVSASLVEGLSA